MHLLNITMKEKHDERSIGKRGTLIFYFFFFKQAYKQEKKKLDLYLTSCGLPWWLSSKEPNCQFRRSRFNPWVEKIPLRRKSQPTPVFLLGKSHGQRSLVGYSPWGDKESDMMKRITLPLLTTDFFIFLSYCFFFLIIKFTKIVYFICHHG